MSRLFLSRNKLRMGTPGQAHVDSEVRLARRGGAEAPQRCWLCPASLPGSLCVCRGGCLCAHAAAAGWAVGVLAATISGVLM
eukprot:COSAG02_NODE_43879_length_371_cov_0.500000_1_plen_81_part_01